MACIPENCQEEYRFEFVRLASFKDWPCSWIKPEKLAAAGFYYTGEEDKHNSEKMDKADEKSTCFMSVSDLDNVTEDIGMLNKILSKPKYPQFDTYEAKINTFEAWPKSSKQTKQDLANAGFHYTGRDDQTLCYYCGGELKDWNPEDVPWEQHAKWFEYCPFLIVCKGRDYINTGIKGTYYTRNNSINSSEKIQEADEKSDEVTGILQQNFTIYT
ncbi:E3 ubiquitin-protein ligase XIAP-like [Pseudomyrmex gracilis]|uniref:E3 ubiquitin-protein ligase XIAP-like n=1 Tax=Pseudomyrmex gracilis TaxID=219809 RepID=UPI000994F14E|nr:E3 ubiquitin-protein ligase XIAP-like [Pseudomyrmex gracilis]